MRTYTWDEYYDKFFDWSESTQVRNLSTLTSLGSADEVGEIIIELQDNVPAANRLLKRAVEEKLEFSSSDLIEFLCINDRELAAAALHNSANRLTARDMEDLYGIAESEDIIAICTKRHLALPEDLREEEELDEEELEDEHPEYAEDFLEKKLEKLGFLGTLAAIIGVSKGIDYLSRPTGHNGRCNGDCANCPPHYGYRYGRWYYGHDHIYGCERGGNKGSGSMD